MQPDFWHDKWQSKQTGFNQAKPNALLTAHFAKLAAPIGSTIFVPLCGKSIDMVWLAAQGYDVIGVDLVEQAVIEFFAENHMSPTGHPHPSHPNLKLYQGDYAGSGHTQSISIWVGDIFELTANDIGRVAAVYDRAALVALPDDNETSLRRRYIKKVIEMTQTAPQLLLNFTVNEDVLDETKGFDKKTFGPPFVIKDDTITDYYQDTYAIKHLAKEAANDTDVLVNQAWLLKPKHSPLKANL